MDEAGRMELIRELCSIERRGPGTDAERRAASLLVSRLRAIGRRAKAEPTYVHPQSDLVHALHAALAIAGSVLATFQPAAGFALVLLTAASMYLDLNTQAYLARSLFFRRASQNVVSPGGRPEAPLRLLLVAHYDAPRSGYLFGERGVRLTRGLSERKRLLLGPWRILFWGGVVALLPILGARMAGLEAGWLAAIQLVPTVLLAVGVLLLLDIALSRTVPGAYDNASGVAAVLSAAESLEQRGLAANLDLWVVLPGSGTNLSEGMRSFIRSQGERLDRERTVIINVDSVSYGTLRYELSEGAVLSTRMDAGLAELCAALAESDPATAATPLRSSGVSDALPGAIRGCRAISLTARADGLAPPWQRSHEDTPERVVGPALARATGFVIALATLLDREAGRSSHLGPDSVI